MYTRECWGNYISVAGQLEVSVATVMPDIGWNQWQSTQVVAFKQLQKPIWNYFQFHGQYQPSGEYFPLGSFYIPSHSGVTPWSVRGRFLAKSILVENQTEQTAALQVGDFVGKTGIKYRVNKRAGEEVRSNNQ